MNPFRPLLKLLDFVLGHDLHERAEQKRPEVRRPPPRNPAPQGDGFDSGSRGPRVDLGGGVKVAPMAPSEPAGPPAVIEPSSFNASLDDLGDVVDEPMQARPEFIPEGGMSTESLMAEFSSLDAQTQAAAVELAAAKELALSLEAEAPEKFVDSFEAAPASVVVSPELVPPAPVPEPVPAPAPDFSHVVDAPLEARPAFVAPGGMSTESLMSEFTALDAETQAAAVAEAAAKEAARAAEEEEAESEDEVDSFEPAAAPPAPMTPAWLIPATSPAPRPPVPVPPPAMSTESLMSEFESLDADIQQAAIDEAAAKELARLEAEAAKEKAEAALVPRGPPPQGVQTPAWLMPATNATPRPPAPAPSPAMSTESLMSEFESLDAETQQAAIEEAAAKELARREAEAAKEKAEAAIVLQVSAPGSALSPTLSPAGGEGDSFAPAPQGVQTPAWLMPATSAAPRPPVPALPPSMSTESLMSEFESLASETQHAAIDEAAAKDRARQEAEVATEEAKQALAPHPDPLPAQQGEGEKS